MPGLVPGIHVLGPGGKQVVDGRDKPGHDGEALRSSQRSSVNTADFEREQQTMILLLSAFSSSLRKESR